MNRTAVLWGHPILLPIPTDECTRQRILWAIARAEDIGVERLPVADFQPQAAIKTRAAIMNRRGHNA